MYALVLRKAEASRLYCALAGIAILLSATVAHAQNGVDFNVKSATQRLEMVVNSSRILTMEKDIPRVLVNNQEILRVVPLSPTKVQVSALKPGVTQVNLWDEDDEVRSVDVIVYADARQLELVLQSEFPSAAIRVRPLASSVVLTGYVDKPETVSRVVRIAEDYYPKVINNISVGGVQQVELHVKVMEVSRTKLRAMGADFGVFTGNDFVIQSVSQLISASASGAGGAVGTGLDTVKFGIVDGGNSLFGFVDALRQYDLLKILAEPTLTTVSGRPASFNEGGEFPIVIPQNLGTNTVEFKQFGTRVDFVPIVLGNGNIRLEVRPEISEIDNSRAITLNGVNIPGLRTRWVDTAVEMRAGQTLALAGLIQNRTESANRGLPWLADLPWAGTLFRRNREEMNEIELLVMVRPELVAALDPHQVPALGPGEATATPNDVDFYFRGYNEVPRCCADPKCPGPARHAAAQAPIGPGGPPMMGPQAMPPQMAPQGYIQQGGPMMGAEGTQGVAPADGANMIMQPGMSYGHGAAGVPADTLTVPQGQMFGPSGYDSLEF